LHIPQVQQQVLDAGTVYSIRRATDSQVRVLPNDIELLGLGGSFDGLALTIWPITAALR
jgi:hypothetical protein